MQIVSLIDNIRLPDQPQLITEHGLSIAILRDEQSILFDSGESDAFLRNATHLGVDVSKFKAGVFSHHHYDHCDGIPTFINENRSAPLYLRPAPDGNCTVRLLRIIRRDVGVEEGLFQKAPQRYHFVDQFTEILPDVYILTEINRQYPMPKGNRHLFLEKNLRYWNDPFEHELILAIKDKGQLIVFTGCSHTGIRNMIEAVVQAFPDTPIEAVFGGYHLIDMPIINNLAGSKRDIEDLGRALLEYPVNRYYTGHCTGLKAYRILKGVMEDRLDYFATGCRVNL